MIRLSYSNKTGVSTAKIYVSKGWPPYLNKKFKQLFQRGIFVVQQNHPKRINGAWNGSMDFTAPQPLLQRLLEVKYTQKCMLWTRTPPFTMWLPLGCWNFRLFFQQEKNLKIFPHLDFDLTPWFTVPLRVSPPIWLWLQIPTKRAQWTSSTPAAKHLAMAKQTGVKGNTWKSICWAFKKKKIGVTWHSFWDT